MVPPRLARKMSVMSVEPPARGAPGGIAAERVHRPGSRRLGGVEATGASPGVAPSRPHRSGPRAGPGRRTPCARGAWGGERAGGRGLRLACPREVRNGAGTTDLNQVVRPRVSEGFPRDAAGKKGYQIAPPAMLLEQVDTTAPKIANSLAREQKARRSRFIATRASRSAAWESQLDMIRPFYSTDLGDRAEH
jgi:hypothetical protein